MALRPKTPLVDELWAYPEWAINSAVLSLAQSAYEERSHPDGPGCVGCMNRGWVEVHHLAAVESFWLPAIKEDVAVRIERKPCPHCSSPDGTLDNAHLAVLSDALEEAGCPIDEQCSYCNGRGEWEEGRQGDDGWVKSWCPPCSGGGRRPHPILDHLRDPGPHVRGCWVLDLLLGKE